MDFQTPEQKNAEQKRLSEIVIEKMMTLVLAGFGLVAALAWDDAIKSLFEQLFGGRKSLTAKFLYAIVVTLIVVIISIKLSNLIKKIGILKSGVSNKNNDFIEP